MKNKVAFTIVAKNRLASAMVCKETFLHYHDDADFIIFLADFIDNKEDIDLLQRCEPVVHLYQLKSLPMLKYSNKLEGMMFRYKIVELCTGIKPFCFQHLFKEGYDKALFFDPDIEFFTNCNKLFDYLDANPIALIPHTLAPYPEDRAKINDIDIITAGVYNLGFIGIKNGQEAQPFLDWWALRLSDNCLHRTDKHIFVDQSWAAMAPAFCNTKIIRDVKYNVAYWNLHERNICKKGNTWLVNKEPLGFYHYSGFDYRYPDILSCYQNRYNFNNRPELRPLFDDYLKKIESYDGIKNLSIPYFNINREPSAHLKGQLGVNLIGYFPHVGGIMECARDFARKLSYTGIKSALYPLKYNNLPLLSRMEEAEFKLRYVDDLRFPISIFFVNLDELGNIHAHYPHLFAGRYNICAPWWELEKPPIGIENAKLVDEFIIFTDFMKKSLSGLKVSRWPYPFLMPNKDDFNNYVEECRQQIGLSMRDYVFFFNFDYGSGFDRKNPLGLLDAFQRAFAGSSQVKLLLKTIREDQYPEQVARLDDAIAKYKIENQVVRIDGNVTRADMLSLINLSDCYASLHRSEGLGIGMCEAISLLKPVIATAYGGHMDYIGNYILPVMYRMTKALDNSYSYNYNVYKDGEWAEPMVEQAVHWMKDVYTQQYRGLTGCPMQKYAENNQFRDKVYKLVTERG
jgi:glycosyltransferase involved in cell wall biosynthesis